VDRHLTRLSNQVKIEYLRVVIVQLDDKYFEQGVVAISSFLKYNKNWDIIITDIGLTPDQKSKLCDYRIINGQKTKNERWGHEFARLATIITLRNYHLILQLDADTLCLGSIESLVYDFLKSQCCFAMATDGLLMKDAINTDLSDIFPGQRSWTNQPNYNWGVFLLNTTKDCKIELMYSLLQRHYDKFPYLEQSCGNAIIWENHLRIYHMPQEYNYIGHQIGVNRVFDIIMMKNTPISIATNKPIRILHLADKHLAKHNDLATKLWGDYRKSLGPS
jgi:lipopolysaccharide biosynthesis glycosyltransferase